MRGRVHGGVAEVGLSSVGLFQDEVDVGATDAERGHTGPAWPVHLGPGARLAQYLDGPLGPVDIRGRAVEVRCGWQPAGPDRQHHLDHAGYAGRGLWVSEVRLE